MQLIKTKELFVPQPNFAIQPMHMLWHISEMLFVQCSVPNACYTQLHLLLDSH